MSIYMQRCLDLAAHGLGNVAPNPLVGAVLVHDDRIIGEGFHQEFGKAHAEVNAITAVRPDDRWRLPKATLYVSLEPCSHFGKTPPCTNAILEAGIGRVVVAMTDPFPLVAGRGIARLREAGVEVLVGEMEAEACYLNRRFLTFHQQHRPYIILKWAQTRNGYFAPHEAKQQWISNHLCQTLAHRWRSEEQAILVGRRTAAIDNPRLNNRAWGGQRQPLRLVLDSHLQLPETLHLFDQTQPTWIVNHQKQDTDNPNLQYIRLDAAQNPLSQLLQHLHAANIQSIIVEGGQQVLTAFIAQQCWDEARIFIGATNWDDGIAAPFLPKAYCHASNRLEDNVVQFWQPIR
ncbi:MAG TPA: bifunctional diaminohydroxyphosphoribosylaminopyrimidine deaminase/5-amino-6-(5-phosphoribosylamino)uracil reductase RibD [Chitinophagales bacterium]|nr:bifunctional diaminohydroxyphosphoribosylaminopyrimidine deaminase/5-amino-6-(5-phosphoribosylamino)uracil reductase RibD [Chitinophagales bacterium]HNL06272.1 bifunctional diaminohydroxyphosphoribosylaminopyrimidine deaminase/5-amino-6-(5-phosphoribosylamino)uracil reductase RibD [Chitinophagales bacterium]